MQAMGHAVFWRESVVTIELAVYALAVEERCTLTYNFTSGFAGDERDRMIYQ